MWILLLVGCLLCMQLYVRNYDAAGFAVSVDVYYEVNYDRVE